MFRNSKGDVIGYSGLIFELLKEVQTDLAKSLIYSLYQPVGLIKIRAKM